MDRSCASGLQQIHSIPRLPYPQDQASAKDRATEATLCPPNSRAPSCSWASGAETSALGLQPERRRATGLASVASIVGLPRASWDRLVIYAVRRR